jgi:hypothetical protein
MIGNARFHGRDHAERLMNPCKIVVHEMQAQDDIAYPGVEAYLEVPFTIASLPSGLQEGPTADTVAERRLRHESYSEKYPLLCVRM